MNDSLLDLRLKLSLSFPKLAHAPENWADQGGMTKALARVQREQGGAGIATDPRSIMAAITDFRRLGTIESFRDLMYVCLGAGIVDASGWCVLADPTLRWHLFGLADGQSEWRRRLRAFQALLSSYWTFPLFDNTTVSEDARQGWRVLRKWLRSERELIASNEEPKPSWFAALTRHVDLLSDEPCGKIGAALLVGDASGLNDAINSLAIPRSSWVPVKAILEQIRAASALLDDAFHETLDRLLAIALGKSGVEISQSLRIRCVARLVSRYAKCADRPEHVGLRDAAVLVIGNPWLQRVKWDAHVVDGTGKPNDVAREMVNGWLKRRLITDFFELLSADGTGDARRLDYWLRFEPLIDDMWFALGRDAQMRNDEHFLEFKRSASGRRLFLENSTAVNNAFLMRIGEYLAVEFGEYGSGGRLFKWSSLDSTVEAALTGKAAERISHNDLRRLECEKPLRHIDSRSESWEQKFDSHLCPLLGRPPKPPRGAPPGSRKYTGGPAASEWHTFVAVHSLSVEDLRAKGGAFWVLGTTFSPTVVKELKERGFRPRPPRGWFVEN